jgi:GNAT superfamily N-acetyltransferase
MRLPGDHHGLGRHMDVVIRLAAPADAPVLSELRYEFRVTRGVQVEPREAFCARCAAWMTERLGESSSWRCWIAETGGRVCGAVWLQVIEKIPNPANEPERHGYVSNFYVREDMRASGIGSRLLQAALDWARGREVDSVILWPTPRSRTLYQRFGFAAQTQLMELQGDERRGVTPNTQLPGCKPAAPDM